MGHNSGTLWPGLLKLHVMHS